MTVSSSRFLMKPLVVFTLYQIATLVDDWLPPQLTIAGPVNDKQNDLLTFPLYGKAQDMVKSDAKADWGETTEPIVEAMNRLVAELQTAESKLKPLMEYLTGIPLLPKLDEGLYLVSFGVHKKSILKLYAIGIYSSPPVLKVGMSPTTLRAMARTFDQSTPITTFVLEMAFGIGVEKIAGAIAKSVKPQYDGPQLDVCALELLIIAGVKGIGGQAGKGMVFLCFDCSKDGVGMSVDGRLQGVATTGAGVLGSVMDMFMDSDTFSHSLVARCVKN
ncbi:hypothetical protein ACHAXA_002247 [Cyclostephanos tholiformis]|uniref:Uncharacterized protein n=1 Tax=Cyclostephanos tholiformis TaxID=382380 RepID=A0ABD3RFW4_9STRA